MNRDLADRLAAVCWFEGDRWARYLANEDWRRGRPVDVLAWITIVQRVLER